MLPEQGRWYCDHLERGKILFFRGMPFEVPDSAIKFLLGHGESASTLHKNISYRPANDVVKGSDLKGADRDHLHAVMRTFSREVTAFITQFLPPYGGKMKLDYASFRPEQEAGRRAFPCTSAMTCCMWTLSPRGLRKGARILRVFLNIHPSMSRIWKVGAPFSRIFSRGLRRLAENQSAARVRPMVAASFGLRLGILGCRSPYVPGMTSSCCNLHNRLKENTGVSKSTPPTGNWSSRPARAGWRYTDGSSARRSFRAVCPGANVSSVSTGTLWYVSRSRAGARAGIHHRSAPGELKKSGGPWQGRPTYRDQTFRDLYGGFVLCRRHRVGSVMRHAALVVADACLAAGVSRTIVVPV